MRDSEADNPAKLCLDSTLTTTFLKNVYHWRLLIVAERVVEHWITTMSISLSEFEIFRSLLKIVPSIKVFMV